VVRILGYRFGGPGSIPGTLNPQKLAPTSPTNGGRSVGIVRSRTQTMEFVCFFNSFFCFLSFLFFLHHGNIRSFYSVCVVPHFNIWKSRSIFTKFSMNVKQLQFIMTTFPEQVSMTWEQNYVRWETLKKCAFFFEAVFCFWECRRRKWRHHRT
jgi:hypothetical protein